MKYFWILSFCFFTTLAHANTITVTGVKVSVTAESAAAARERALDQAHDLAFGRILSENFPEVAASLPPHETIVNMVKDFSIDREKTTPKGYSASLTFQFDGPQVESWIQKGPAQNSTASETTSSQAEGNSLKIVASYAAFPEWLHIKRTLESAPGIENVTISSLTPQKATVQTTFRGQVEKLRQHLSQQGLLLSPQEEGWLISSNSPSPR